MKKIILSMACVAIVSCMVGCENADSDMKDTIISESDSTENLRNGGKDSEFMPLRINYHLENEKGENATTFAEGENIIFDLAIYNDSLKDITFAEEREIVMSCLSVYDINGNYIGNPWVGMDMDASIWYVTIKANGSEHWRIPWMYDEKYMTERSCKIGIYPMKDPLPSGKYYSCMKCRISICGENVWNVDKKIEFEIR